MKLLIITQKVDPKDNNLGFFHRWLEEFSGRVEKLYVVGGFVGNHFLSSQIQVVSLGKERGLGRIRRYWNFYKYLFQILPKIDAVLVHMIPAWVILLWLPAWAFKKKVYLWYTHKSVTISLRIAEKLVANIFTASKASCRLLSKKIIVTGHGIDVNHFQPKDIKKNSNELRLLAVGRISESKDYEFLLKAVDILRRKNIGKSVVFHILGEPVTKMDKLYKERLMALVRVKDWGNSVKFLGSKTYKELPDVYNSYDVLLHASVTGSIDKVVLESMACGLPVITTSEAFRDLLPSQYLLNHKDSEAMAEKILALKNINKDLSLREIVVKNHNLDNVVRNILKYM